ncbi:uncharacterized protein GGS25DRAFT_481434 [Hypoxylon fragiforme]|uniref:uncharacterized protein n=1 Tax=Hypoxylon fragiforme TaxID=63214 RepID=UPI0020C6B311|nr:uncharacterized protein GGS25DRAFT_481434 [Hypoxylon fragiforme]KAI2611111.1 hypothetical protein GGS25DRAFT_481434 [Hypoxylon fragiforme]
MYALCVCVCMCVCMCVRAYIHTCVLAEGWIACVDVDVDVCHCMVCVVVCANRSYRNRRPGYSGFADLIGRKHTEVLEVGLAYWLAFLSFFTFFLLLFTYSTYYMRLLFFLFVRHVTTGWWHQVCLLLLLLLEDYDVSVGQKLGD